MPTLPRPNPAVAALPAPKALAGPHNTAPGALLLHLGEAWFEPSPAVQIALAALASQSLRYPDPLSIDLRRALAGYVGHGIAAEQIIVGNGSDGLIDLLVRTYAGPGRAVVAPAPTFFVYGHAAKLQGAELLTGGRRPQSEGFALDLAALPREAGVIFLASPNNPTGDLLDLATIRAVAESTEALVVIDECYFEFAGETALPLLAALPNLVILRSLSKSFALAGLRAGYALAHPEIIAMLERCDQTFSVNLVAQRAGLAALQSLEYYRPLFEKTREFREQLALALTQLGLRVSPSRANILLADYSALTTGNLAVALLADGIHVADFHSRGPIQNAMRIAVCDEAATERLLDSLRRTLERLSARG